MRWRVRALAAVGASFVLAAGACSSISGSGPTLEVGAVYPLSGSQGPGGVEEHRGVLLAAQLANEDDTLGGTRLEIRSVDVPSSDVASQAVADLGASGVRLVLGSYGSTISANASAEAASRGMLFWETGAVGMLPAASDLGGSTFRVPPTGSVLGRAAIGYVAERLAPERGLSADDLRFAVSFVDDVYGRSVAQGAIDEIRARGLRSVGSFGYDDRTFDVRRLVRRIARVRPDVLFVSAYLVDAIALRRELVRQDVPLVVNIGTSSSFCMPEFGATLGRDAVGTFASDKPSATAIDPTGLRPSAAALLARANDAYRSRWGSDMSPPALAGFSAAWSLFRYVLPAATAFDPNAVAAAARRIALPPGSLPNGSGLRFGDAGSRDAGDNLAAASVIWEWVAPGRAVVVWPPAFATDPVDPTGADDGT